MLTIKVAFKGKNILLSKGVNSIEKIKEELAVRFPIEEITRVCFSYKNQEINSYDRIREIVETEGLKSIKIEAVLPQKPSSQIYVSKNSFAPTEQIVIDQQKMHKDQAKVQQLYAQTEQINLSSRLNNQQIFQIEQKDHMPQKEEIIQKDKLIIDKEKIAEEKALQNWQMITQRLAQFDRKIKTNFIRHYIKTKNLEKQQKILEEEQRQKCQEQKRQKEQKIEEEKVNKIEEMEQDIYQCFYCLGKKQCNACGSKGRFSEESPFIKLIDRIIDARIERKMKPEKFKAVKDEEKISSFEHDQQILKKVWIEDGDNGSGEAIEGEKFYWKFVLMAPKPLKNKIQIHVLDEDTSEQLLIDFEPGKKFVVGPYIPKTYDLQLRRSYRLLFYNEKSEVVSIGPKFGFSAIVLEPRKPFSISEQLLKKQESSQDRKNISSNFRIRINQLLIKHNKMQSVDETLKMLKELGITEQNFEVESEMMQQIVVVL